MAQDNIFNDRMFFDEEKYPLEIRKDGDGFYRWRYKLDEYHDRKEYSFLIKFWLIFAIAGFILGILIGSKSFSPLLCGIGGFAVFFIFGLLISGLIRLMDGGPSLRWYRMNDEFVQIQPSGKGSGISHFEIVRKVFLDPEHNEIKMSTRYGPAYVFGRKEDFELLKTHILACVPEGTEIIYNNAESSQNG